ncbi:MAG: MmgE/PrpD family protein [Proteobacteria bacterium]|nr:MmgE/PrpD family protein [Pseudomonadota bacterium]
MSDQIAAASQGIARLAEWAATVRAADVPETALRRAALIVVDDVAAMVAAGAEPELRPLRERLAASAGPAEATVFGDGALRAERSAAACANGTAANWCELDEGFRVVGCHGGLYAAPAALAEAEAAGLSTEATLRAIVVGYEVVTRFARAFRFPPRPRTVHPHSTFAALGAAAAVAAARGLKPGPYLAALTSASTLITVGPYTHAVKGALIENAWAGVGAWCGFRAVDWAEFGIGGLAESPYEVYAGCLRAESRPEELTRELGRAWQVDQGYHKLYACCGHTHSTVEATMAALARMPKGKSISNIERIEVETHNIALNLVNRRPETTLGARFSLPQIVAATAVFGHAGPEAFAHATLSDRGIARLRDRVEVRLFEPEMAPPNDRPARVHVTLDGGERLSGECLSARGGPDRPLATEEILAKAARLTAGVYPGYAAGAGRLVALERATLARPWREAVAELTAAPGARRRRAAP